MADDQFQMGSGNWWETSRNRYDGGTTPTSISTTLNSIATFGWPTEMVDMKPRSSMDPATPSDAASMVLQSGGGAHDHQSSASAGGGGGVLDSPNLQLMGFGLSSHSMDWNQALFRGEKTENSFRSLLQEDLSSNSSGFQQESGPAGSSSQEHWRQKLSDENEFKQINRGFSLDQPQFNSQASSNDSSITSQNLNTGFQADSAAAYGFLLSENRPMNYPYPSSGYGANVGELIPSWNKYQQFLRTSPPPPPAASSGHLHFTNHTSFWNASATPPTDARSSFFPALQTQINPPASSFDEKPKNPREVQDLGATTKKNNTETSIKRPRNETPPPNLPAFKVRKEKMGDRITALQQLVSPFGKTDTASVLSEAIEYIKFLHGQVSALSTPYMKNGAPTQHHHQDSDISKDPEGPRHDLRSRGLCLVPVSSTFPMTHETAVDFWSPTFGGTFR